MTERAFYFAAHAEMQDAAKQPLPVEAAPAAASVELAKLVTRFETAIDDEWRAAIILIGGALLRVGNTNCVDGKAA